jgi:hypothetical protein
MEAIETAAQTVASSRVVLVVDLDGTLIRTDLCGQAGVERAAWVRFAHRDST